MTAGLEPREVLACVILALLAMWAAYQLGRAAGVRIGERRGFADGVERMRSSDFGDVDPLAKFRGSLVTPREFVRMRSGRVVTSPQFPANTSGRVSPAVIPPPLPHLGDLHTW